MYLSSNQCKSEIQSSFWFTTLNDTYFSCIIPLQIPLILSMHIQCTPDISVEYFTELDISMS